MVLERTDDEVIIKVSADIDELGFQYALDCLNFLEITSKSKVPQAVANDLADKLNHNWWEKNKSRFINCKHIS